MAPMAAPQPARVVVVGGGPAGSLAAMQLAKRGWAVDVYERMDMETLQRKTSRSYPMVVNPRAWLGLEEVGAPPSALSCTHDPMQGFVRNGTIVPRMSMAASYVVDRASLAGDMAEAALRLYPGAVTFHGRAELQGVEWGERRVTVRQTGQNGEEKLSQVPYDLLVGADGANSAVRRCLEEHQPGFKSRTVLAARTGYKSYNQLPSILKDGSEAVPGISGHAPGQYLYSWAPSDADRKAEDPDNRLPALTMKMDTDRTLSGLMARATDFRPDRLTAGLTTTFPAIPQEWVQSLVQQMQEGAQPLSSFGRIVRCERFHGPRTVLLGDAAHAVTSAMGQGCNLACESVRVFARALDDCGGDLDALPAAFSRMRVDDAHAMQTMEKMQVLVMPPSIAGPPPASDEPLFLARIQAQIVMLLPAIAGTLLQKLLPFIKVPMIFTDIIDPSQRYTEVLRNARLRGLAVLSLVLALAAVAATKALAALKVAMAAIV